MLVMNGSPTKEILIQKGLKQGDPLASFLYLMMTTGLNGLIKSAVEKRMFKGSKIGSKG